MAYEPKSAGMTSVHLFAEGGGRGGLRNPVEARGVQVHSMGCGWIE